MLAAPQGRRSSSLGTRGKGQVAHGQPNPAVEPPWPDLLLGDLATEREAARARPSDRALAGVRSGRAFGGLGWLPTDLTRSHGEYVLLVVLLCSTESRLIGGAGAAPPGKARYAPSLHWTEPNLHLPTHAHTQVKHTRTYAAAAGEQGPTRAGASSPSSTRSSGGGSAAAGMDLIEKVGPSIGKRVGWVSRIMGGVYVRACVRACVYGRGAKAACVCGSVRQGADAIGRVLGRSGRGMRGLPADACGVRCACRGGLGGSTEGRNRRTQGGGKRRTHRLTHSFLISCIPRTQRTCTACRKSKVKCDKVRAYVHAGLLCVLSVYVRVSLSVCTCAAGVCIWIGVDRMYINVLPTVHRSTN